MVSSAILPLLFCVGAVHTATFTSEPSDVTLATFTSEPSDVTLSRDETAVLSCQLSDLVTCAWRLEHTGLNSSGFLNTVPPPLVKPVTPLHPSDCSVTLAHPSAAYSGRYQCAPYTEGGEQILSRWATVQVTPDEFTCPTEEGIFPDPNDCQYYYVCSNSTPAREMCTSPLVFNPRLLTCDYIENVPECQ